MQQPQPYIFQTTEEFSFKILSPQSAVCSPSPLCQTCFWKKSPCSRERRGDSTPAVLSLSKYSAEKRTSHSYQMWPSADRSSSAFVSLPFLPVPSFFFPLNSRNIMPTHTHKRIMTFLLNSSVLHMLDIQPARSNKHLLLCLEYKGGRR